MWSIKIKIDDVIGQISVWNDGQGIEVWKHQKEKHLYVPELIFGELLTSSNYDDKVKKVTGGRNGLGAKLANAYSTMFEVEVADSKNRKLYKQVWRDNMSVKEPADI